MNQIQTCMRQIQFADHRNLPMAGILMLVVVIGCNARDEASQSNSRNVQPTQEQVETQSETENVSQSDDAKKMIQHIMEEKKLVRVGKFQKFAPTDCRRPMIPLASFYSQSLDKKTHGKKLYDLYVKYRDEYAAWGVLATDLPQTASVGQVLVKDSFHAVELESAAMAEVSRGEKHYKRGERYGYFVMAKVDPETPNTDQGWIYATLTPDHTITAVGRIESCMKCHVDAPHDRLFGQKK